ncbi:hypothetical protein [Embleya scabrispora]|uniref:hypothetical protein n=1 Tax=Embleya scabrispora TaxID=159449 RepID=UPI0011801DEA|nr:hypothetical protein [Embleya scabrispora]
MAETNTTAVRGERVELPNTLAAPRCPNRGAACDAEIYSIPSTRSERESFHAGLRQRHGGPGCVRPPP